MQVVDDVVNGVSPQTLCKFDDENSSCIGLSGSHKQADIQACKLYQTEHSRVHLYCDFAESRGGDGGGTRVRDDTKENNGRQLRSVSCHQPFHFRGTSFSQPLKKTCQNFQIILIRLLVRSIIVSTERLCFISIRYAHLARIASCTFDITRDKEAMFEIY